MRFFRQSLMGMFLAAVALGLLVYAGALVTDALSERLANAPRAAQAQERVFAVRVVRAKAQDVAPVLQGFGQVQSRRSLELRAAVAGRIVALSEAFVEGGVVEAGEVLARIDRAALQAARDQADTDLQRARAEGRDAARTLDIARAEVAAAVRQDALQQRALQRQQDLQSRGVGTPSAAEAAELAAAAATQAVLARRQAVAQAEARVDQAASALRRAEIALAEAERQLNETVLRAAFEGALAGVEVVEGRRVSVNERLATLVDTQALEVAFRVSNAQYARLLGADGALNAAHVRVSLGAGAHDLHAQARIERQSAEVGADQTGRLLFARMEAAPAFKPGDFVSVAVTEPVLRDVVRLPALALGADGTVLVLGPDERLALLPVSLLRRQGDDVLVRASDLDGREVVAARTPLLDAGVKVRVLRSEASETAHQDQAMLTLSADRRARLVAFVTEEAQLSDVARARFLAHLARPDVPAHIVARIEARMGG